MGKRKITLTGVILETGGSVQKIQKRALFHYKKVLKGTRNFTSPCVNSLFTIVWIKQIFEKQVIEDSVRKSDSVLT